MNAFANFREYVMSDEVEMMPPRKKAGRPRKQIGKKYQNIFMHENTSDFLKKIAIARGQSLGTVVDHIVAYLIEHKVDLEIPQALPKWMVRHEKDHAKYLEAMRARKLVDQVAGK